MLVVDLGDLPPLDSGGRGFTNIQVNGGAMNFYRKYRPKKIAELDLAGVRETLSHSFKDGKFAQAYLFVGPRGAGKTSAARIVAKVVNCLNLKDGEPCLTCDLCKGIEDGSVVDVMEIDAASHRGIDAIRELKDKIGLAPVQAKKKVYIIDEVHMLTMEAFNALLKTLEEPPAHVVFVLCTTEIHKVPETIMSRCVKVNFTKGSQEEVLESLKKVVKGENLSADEEGLKILANSVDGSFREGHKLLEQLAVGNEKITVEVVTGFLGGASDLEPKKLAELLLSGKSKEALEELALVESRGVNLAVYSENLLNFLRGELRAKYGIGKPTTNFPVERIKLVTEKVAAACVAIKSAVVEILPLELIAVEIGAGGAPSVQQVREVSRPSESVAPKQEIRVAEPVTTTAPQEVIESEEPSVTVAVNVSLDEVVNNWSSLIALLEPQNHSVAGLLRSCRPKRVEDRFLVIEAYYKFHKEQLEQEARRRMVEAALKKQVGLPGVKFVLGERASEVAKAMPQHDNVGAPSGDDKLIEAVGDVFGVEV